MTIEHETLVWLSKSIGLFYLIALAAMVLLYVYAPSNKQRLERAARTILHDDEDRPWR